MSATLNEQDQWVDEATGELVVNGFVFYGDQNLDPVLNPLAGGIFSDRALTVALANPQRTGADGRTVNKVWLSGRYSIKLEDSNNVQLYQELDVGENETTGTTSLTNVQGTNTITADGVPTVDELVNGQFYVFIPANTNTGAATLKIDSTTAKAVEVNGGALTGNELAADITVAVAFNSAADVFDMVVQVNRSALGLGTTDNVVFNSVTSTTSMTAATAEGGMIATQAEQETGTAVDQIVTPGRQQFHSSAAKAWLKMDGTGTAAIDVSFGVTSITDFATGNYGVTFSTAFSTVDYVVVGICAIQANPRHVFTAPSVTPTTTLFRFFTKNLSDALEDTDFIFLSAFGDQ